MKKNTSILDSATFAFLDIETTGGNNSHDRITEVGIRFWRAGEVVDEWQTLINPETRISPFIQSLTGISNAMVAEAPVFAGIAGELEQQLKDTILVAHNARFDYGFIKSEFRRLGLLFSAKVLCTVKLSRKLYPGFRHHNMDALIERHGLDQVQRHRAMGDVSAMLAFFEHALAEKGEEAMEAAIGELLQRPSIPSNRMSESLRRVDWTETTGELGALLLELKQIKQLKPLFNRRSRAAKNLVSIELAKNVDGYLQARLVREIEPHRLGDYFGLFRSKTEAEKALSGIAVKNDLCNKLLGLEPDHEGPCFQRTLGRCKGACDGGENVVKYNLRVQIAFHALRLKTWPWKGPVEVVEHNERTGTVAEDRGTQCRGRTGCAHALSGV